MNVSVDEVCLETSWSDVVLAKVSLKVDIVCQCLLGEVNISAHCGLLLILLATILLHSSHSLVELILEDLDGLDRRLGNILAESGVELPHLIDVHTESLTSADHVLHPASVLREAHEVVGCLLHGELLLVGTDAGTIGCHI